MCRLFSKKFSRLAWVKIKSYFVWFIRRILVSIIIAWILSQAIGAFLLLFAGGILSSRPQSAGATAMLESIPIFVYQLFSALIIVLFILLCIPPFYKRLISVFFNSVTKEDFKKLSDRVEELDKIIRQHIEERNSNSKGNEK